MNTLNIPTDLSMVIGGEHARAADGRVLETSNPATGEVLAVFPRAGEREVDGAVRAAAAAFDGWRDTPPLQRVAALHALADRIEDADELGLIDVAENGSPIREMRKDAGIAAWLIRYLAGLTLQVCGETMPSDPTRFNFSLLQPFGVVGRIRCCSPPAGSRLRWPSVTRW
jgi:betaine-aldehyde dehydrogenase